MKNLFEIWESEMKRDPIFTFDGGEFLYVQPSSDGLRLEAGRVTNVGLIPEYQIDYDFDFPLDWNLVALYEEIENDLRGN